MGIGLHSIWIMHFKAGLRFRWGKVFIFGKFLFEMDKSNWRYISVNSQWMSWYDALWLNHTFPSIRQWSYIARNWYRCVNQWWLLKCRNGLQSRWSSPVHILLLIIIDVILISINLCGTIVRANCQWSLYSFSVMTGKCQTIGNLPCKANTGQ